MSSDPIELLRALNPEPTATAPPIDTLWRRLEEAGLTAEHRDAGGGRSAQRARASGLCRAGAGAFAPPQRLGIESAGRGFGFGGGGDRPRRGAGSALQSPRGRPGGPGSAGSSVAVAGSGRDPRCPAATANRGRS